MKRVFVILIALTFINVNVAAAKKRKPDCTWQLPQSQELMKLMIKGAYRLANVKGVTTIPARRGYKKAYVNWFASASKAYYWKKSKPNFVFVVYKFRHYKTKEWVYQIGGHLVKGLKTTFCKR